LLYLVACYFFNVLLSNQEIFISILSLGKGYLITYYKNHPKELKLIIIRAIETLLMILNIFLICLIVYHFVFNGHFYFEQYLNCFLIANILITLSLRLLRKSVELEVQKEKMDIDIENKVNNYSNDNNEILSLPKSIKEDFCPIHGMHSSH